MSGTDHLSPGGCPAFPVRRASQGVDGHGAAALAIVEILLWQLLRGGVLPAAALAHEIERYARLHDDGGDASNAAVAGTLRALARVARGAARICSVDQPPAPSSKVEEFGRAGRRRRSNKSKIPLRPGAEGDREDAC